MPKFKGGRAKAPLAPLPPKIKPGSDACLTFLFSEKFLKDGFPEDAPVIMHVQAEEGVPWQWGESPSCCRGDHLTGHTEERVLWPARTKRYAIKLVHQLVITPRTCARGKAIGLSDVVCRRRYENRQILRSRYPSNS